MPLEDHLDDDLEEFCRLHRLGDFTSARRFFEENLQSHLDKPHVLVEYMEMLLEQGDYNAIFNMEEESIRCTISRIKDEEDSELLMSYLDLIKATGAFHKAEIPRIDFLKNIMQSLNILHTAIDPEEYDEDWDISSTEIKMLALLFRLSLGLWRQVPSKFLDLSSPKFGRKLYAMLLRNGRIWDLHDIAVAQLLGLENADTSEHWNDESSFRKRIQKLLSDWLNGYGTYDISTVLGLLGLLMCFTITLLTRGKAVDQQRIEYMLGQSMPLASFVIENEPSKMRSRPFIMWILAKSMFANCDGFKNIVSQHEYLLSFPGIFFIQGNGLPTYVSDRTETPTWKPGKVGPEFEKPLRMALKKSSTAGDYRTEAMALAALIRISTEPEEEFTHLGNLQKLTQGSIHDYCQTLASRYLMLNTEESRNSIRKDISDLFPTSRPSRDMSKLDPENYWVLRELLDNLEGKKPDLLKSDDIGESISGPRNTYTQQSLISIKGAPNVETHPLQTDDAHGSPPSLASTKCEDGRGKSYIEHNVTDTRSENLEVQKYHNSNSSSDISRDFGFFARPHMLQGKRVIIAFENIESPSEREEIVYQFDAEQNREFFEKMNPSSQILVQVKDGKIMREFEIPEAAKQSTTLEDQDSKDCRHVLFRRPIPGPPGHPFPTSARYVMTHLQYPSPFAPACRYASALRRRLASDRQLRTTHRIATIYDSRRTSISKFWVKTGLCSADSIINILLCMLGYVRLPPRLPSSPIQIHFPLLNINLNFKLPSNTLQLPGLIHSWYIISKFPELYEYESATPQDAESGGRVTYVFVSQPPQSERPPQASPTHPNYGTANTGSNSAHNGSSSAAGPSAGPHDPAPPTYAEAVKGDNKVQTQD
ncbi:hypothetical protein ABKA04_009087 [Annulohypoxylon sp. FPYF3050]